MSPSAGPTKGSLIAIGGVGSAPDIDAEVNRLSRPGGVTARWVYIPTAAEDGKLEGAPPLVAASDPNFVTRHTRDPAEADTPAFCAALRTATAVWFGGGRQWRLVTAYAGTLMQGEIEAVLKRGGLVAGSSAGAVIQGSYLVRGGELSNERVMSPDHEEGFAYLKNVGIDTHVDNPNHGGGDRRRGLIALVSARPELLGIGIAERTAVVVEGDTMTVAGQSYVLVTDPGVRGGEPYTLTPGSRFDLRTRRRL